MKLAAHHLLKSARNHRACADDRVIPDGDAGKDDGSCSNHGAFTDCDVSANVTDWTDGDNVVKHRVMPDGTTSADLTISYSKPRSLSGDLKTL